jgi:hypothetical protein
LFVILKKLSIVKNIIDLASILDPATVRHQLINTIIEQAMAKHKAFNKN